MFPLFTRQAAQALRQPLLRRSFTVSARRGNESELLLRIRTNLKDAMRAKDNTASIWKSLLSAHEYSQKSGQPAPLMTTLRKAYKQRLESAAAYRAATPTPREDLAVKEDAEAALLSALLPPPVTASEMEAFIETAVETLSDKGQALGTPGKKGQKPKMKIGSMMKAVKELSQDRAEAKDIQNAIRAYIAKREAEGRPIE